MELLNWYFERRLESWGYGECRIRYNLNYCQGDGVAWYGKLDEADVLRMLPRLGLSASETAAIQRVVDDINVSISDINHHYHHWNSMEVDVEVLNEDEMSGAETEAVDALLKALREDVVTRSRELESEGYSLIEASPYEPEILRLYERENLVVEIRKQPVEDAGDPILGYMEPSDVFLLARRMIRGEIERYELEVRATWWGKEESLWIGATDGAPNGRQWVQLAREALSDIASELRPQVPHAARPAALQARAA